MGGRGSAGGAAKSAVEYKGDVRYSVTDFGDGSGEIRATQDYATKAGWNSSREVASLEWGKTGEIAHVEVRSDRRRIGIASEMLRRGQAATGGRIAHSSDRTGLGEAWARSVGGSVPKRSQGSAARAGRDLGRRSRYAD